MRRLVFALVVAFGCSDSDGDMSDSGALQEADAAQMNMHDSGGAPGPSSGGNVQTPDGGAGGAGGTAAGTDSGAGAVDASTDQGGDAGGVDLTLPGNMDRVACDVDDGAGCRDERFEVPATWGHCWGGICCADGCWNGRECVAEPKNFGHPCP